MPVTFAHNGGNDAVYELRAYLAELGLESKQWNELTDYRSLPMMEEIIPPPPPRERKPKKASNNVDMPGVNVRRAPRRSTARVQQEVSQEQPLFADSRVFPSLGSRAPTLRREDQGMPADLARLVESAQLVDSANPQAGAKDSKSEIIKPIDVTIATNQTAGPRRQGRNTKRGGKKGKAMSVNAFMAS